MTKINTLITAFTIATLGAMTGATAAQINTGGENGAYQSEFCPRLQSSLKKARFDYKCTPSKGSVENIQRVTANPGQLGFSQLDIFALENGPAGSGKKFTSIRSDIGRECLFLVTKNKEITNYGQVAATAARLHFILPPEGSGHTGTFRYLQKIDPDGLGKADSITYADSTDTALEAVLTSTDTSTITVFVQFPNPDNTRFKKIADQGGSFIPLIDRNILRQQIDGEKVYYAEETSIVNPNWTEPGVKVVTACTPIVLFTGSSDNVADDKDRLDHTDLIETVRDLDVSELRPEEGWFSSLWKQTKSLSAESVETVLQTTEKARESAGPMMEKAKEMGSDAMEKASEISKQAREMAGPVMEKAKEMGKKAMEKAGEMADKATESTNEDMKKDE